MCALGVLVAPDLTVQAAGGLLLQLLPFCPDDVIDRVEKNVAVLPSITSMLTDGLTPRQIVERVLDGMPFDVLDTAAPGYRCACSRQKVERALASMSREERMALPDGHGMTEVTCNFCDKVYRFTREELERIGR